VKIIMDLLC